MRNERVWLLMWMRETGLLQLYLYFILMIMLLTNEYCNFYYRLIEIHYTLLELRLCYWSTHTLTRSQTYAHIALKGPATGHIRSQTKVMTLFANALTSSSEWSLQTPMLIIELGIKSSCLWGIIYNIFLMNRTSLEVTDGLLQNLAQDTLVVKFVVKM